MAIFRSIAIFVLAVRLVSTAWSSEIAGQVFIVTNGGLSIKLGLVKVSLYDLKAMEDALQARKTPASPVIDYFNEESRKHKIQGDALSAEWDAMSKKTTPANDEASEAERDQLFAKFRKVTSKYFEERAFGDFPSSGQYCFQVLPPALQSTKTDADGRFSFQAGDGSYALAAKATREFMGKTEIYYWIVKVPPGSQSKVTVLLSDDNCSYTKDDKSSPEVLLHDLDFKKEAKVQEGMGDHDLPWLLNYIEERKKADAAAEKK